MCVCVCVCVCLCVVRTFPSETFFAVHIIMSTTIPSQRRLRIETDKQWGGGDLTRLFMYRFPPRILVDCVEI